MKYENFEGDKNTGDSRNFTSLFLKVKILSFRKKQQNENEKAGTSTEKEQWALFEEQEIRLKANSITKGGSKQKIRVFKKKNA